MILRSTILKKTVAGSRSSRSGFSVQVATAAGRSGAWLTGCGVLTLVVFFATGVQRPVMAYSERFAPMERLVYPLGHHENGQMKTELFARRAWGEKTLQAEDVALTMYDENGRVNGRLLAERCSVDAESQQAWSDDGKIRMEREGVVLEGRGFRLDMDKQRLAILENVRLTIPEGTVLPAQMLQEKK